MYTLKRLMNMGEEYIMNMTKEQKMVELGAIGEEMVADLFRLRGHKVVLSENKYDSEKDMMIDGQTCEVKTQMPYFLRKLFSVKPDQHFKCINADKLIWVEAPSKHNDYRVDIYEAPARGKRVFIKYKAKKNGVYVSRYGMSFDDTKILASFEGSIEAIRMINLLTNSDMTVVNKLNVH